MFAYLMLVQPWDWAARSMPESIVTVLEGSPNGCAELEGLAFWNVLCEGKVLLFAACERRDAATDGAANACVLFWCSFRGDTPCGWDWAGVATLGNSWVTAGGIPNACATFCCKCWVVVTIGLVELVVTKFWSQGAVADVAWFEGYVLIGRVRIGELEGLGNRTFGWINAEPRCATLSCIWVPGERGRGEPLSPCFTRSQNSCSRLDNSVFAISISFNASLDLGVKLYFLNCKRLFLFEIYVID